MTESEDFSNIIVDKLKFKYANTRKNELCSLLDTGENVSCMNDTKLVMCKILFQLTHDDYNNRNEEFVDDIITSAIYELICYMNGYIFKSIRIDTDIETLNDISCNNLESVIMSIDGAKEKINIITNKRFSPTTIVMSGDCFENLLDCNYFKNGIYYNSGKAHYKNLNIIENDYIDPDNVGQMLICSPGQLGKFIEIEPCSITYKILENDANIHSEYYISSQICVEITHPESAMWIKGIFD